MHFPETTTNTSSIIHSSESVDDAKLINDSQRQIFEVINFVFLGGVICALGIFGNAINLIVFYKQGLNKTINISFFSMALADLLCLILQQWFNICMNPLFQNADLPFVPLEVQLVLASIPRELFARVTCIITVYITAERWLCITFPLHVKRMITPERTTIIIIILYVLTIASIFPMFCTTYLGWKFYPHLNKTLLGIKFTEFRDQVEGGVYFVHAILSVFYFTTVIMFTAILIRKLSQKSAWRSAGTADREQSETISNRDRKTSRTVVLIASVWIVCYAPSVIVFLASFLHPGLSFVGKYANIWFVTWSFIFLLEGINSSVNIIFYFKMSSKYRQTFMELFHEC